MGPVAPSRLTPESSPTGLAYSLCQADVAIAVAITVGSSPQTRDALSATRTRSSWSSRPMGMCFVVTEANLAGIDRPPCAPDRLLQGAALGNGQSVLTTHLRDDQGPHDKPQPARPLLTAECLFAVRRSFTSESRTAPSIT